MGKKCILDKETKRQINLMIEDGVNHAFIAQQLKVPRAAVSECIDISKELNSKNSNQTRKMGRRPAAQRSKSIQNSCSEGTSAIRNVNKEIQMVKVPIDVMETLNVKNKQRQDKLDKELLKKFGIRKTVKVYLGKKASPKDPLDNNKIPAPGTKRKREEENKSNVKKLKNNDCVEKDKIDIFPNFKSSNLQSMEETRTRRTRLNKNMTKDFGDIIYITDEDESINSGIESIAVNKNKVITKKNDKVFNSAVKLSTENTNSNSEGGKPKDSFKKGPINLNMKNSKSVLKNSHDNLKGIDSNKNLDLFSSIEDNINNIVKENNVDTKNLRELKNINLSKKDNRVRSIKTSNENLREVKEVLGKNEDKKNNSPSSISRKAGKVEKLQNNVNSSHELSTANQKGINKITSVKDNAKEEDKLPGQFINFYKEIVENSSKKVLNHKEMSINTKVNNQEKLNEILTNNEANQDKLTNLKNKVGNQFQKLKKLNIINEELDITKFVEAKGIVNQRAKEKGKERTGTNDTKLESPSPNLISNKDNSCSLRNSMNAMQTNSNEGKLLKTNLNDKSCKVGISEGTKLQKLKLEKNKNVCFDKNVTNDKSVESNFCEKDKLENKTCRRRTRKPNYSPENYQNKFGENSNSSMRQSVLKSRREIRGGRKPLNKCLENPNKRENMKNVNVKNEEKVEDCEYELPKFAVVDTESLTKSFDNLVCSECFKHIDVQFPSTMDLPDTEFHMKCKSCNHLRRFKRSKSCLSEISFNTIGFDSMYLRLIFSCLDFGGGFDQLKSTCMALNIPQLNFSSYKKYCRYIIDQSKLKLDVILKLAGETVHRSYKSIGINPDENGIRNINVTYDSTWMKKGKMMRYGLIVAVDLSTGLVLDFHLMSKYCGKCVLAKKKKLNNFEEWMKNHKERNECQINYESSSAEMELDGALILCQRSIQYHKLRYNSVSSDISMEPEELDVSKVLTLHSEKGIELERNTDVKEKIKDNEKQCDELGNTLDHSDSLTKISKDFDNLKNCSEQTTDNSHLSKSSNGKAYNLDQCDEQINELYHCEESSDAYNFVRENTEENNSDINKQLLPCVDSNVLLNSNNEVSKDNLNYEDLSESIIGKEVFDNLDSNIKSEFVESQEANDLKLNIERDKETLLGLADTELPDPVLSLSCLNDIEDFNNYEKEVQELDEKSPNHVLEEINISLALDLGNLNHVDQYGEVSPDLVDYMDSSDAFNQVSGEQTNWLDDESLNQTTIDTPEDINILNKNKLNSFEDILQINDAKDGNDMNFTSKVYDCLENRLVGNELKSKDSVSKVPPQNTNGELCASYNDVGLKPSSSNFENNVTIPKGCDENKIMEEESNCKYKVRQWDNCKMSEDKILEKENYDSSGNKIVEEEDCVKNKVIKETSCDSVKNKIVGEEGCDISGNKIVHDKENENSKEIFCISLQKDKSETIFLGFPIDQTKQDEVNTLDRDLVNEKETQNLMDQNFIQKENEEPKSDLEATTKDDKERNTFEIIIDHCEKDEMNCNGNIKSSISFSDIEKVESKKTEVREEIGFSNISENGEFQKEKQNNTSNSIEKSMNRVYDVKEKKDVGDVLCIDKSYIKEMSENEKMEVDDPSSNINNESGAESTGNKDNLILRENKISESEIEEATKEFNSEIKKAAKESDSELKKAAKESDSEIKEFDSEIKKAAKESDSEIIKAAKESDSEIKAAAKESDSEIKAAANESDSEIKAAAKESDSEIKAAVKESDSEIKEAAKETDSEIKAAANESDSEIKAAAKESDYEIKAAAKESDSEIKAAAKESDSEIKEAAKETNSEIKAAANEFDSEIKAAAKESDSQTKAAAKESDSQTKAAAKESDSQTKAAAKESDSETKAAAKESDSEIKAAAKEYISTGNELNEGTEISNSKPSKEMDEVSEMEVDESNHKDEKKNNGNEEPAKDKISEMEVDESDHKDEKKNNSNEEPAKDKIINEDNDNLPGPPEEKPESSHSELDVQEALKKIKTETLRASVWRKCNSYTIYSKDIIEFACNYAIITHNISIKKFLENKQF